ncbi:MULTISPECIES: tyrosine-type recombinase/integrase [Bhargavaea]|uniref:Tyrosine-type recombinase/integrase n=1 Tax=Bhargavaea changchunensis TaxID=2134037 RepID=A0ABW2NED0_9BACL|nr:site-specific integrase [Bhargavaea sp. CC-171006]
MERFPSKKEKEVFYYYTGKKEKKWGYRMRYYDALGKRREKSKQGLPSENAAIRALLEVKASIFNGETRQIEKSNMTVSEWVDIWFDTKQHKWKVSTRDHREGIINNYIKPLIGRYKLSSLDRTTYEREFLNVLHQKLAQRTVHLYHQTFMIVVNAAVDDEYLPRNRFSGMSVDETRKKTAFLDARQLNAFLKAVSDHALPTHSALFHLLAYSGLRLGEALGLTWEDIDAQKRTITVNRTRDTKGVRSPKTLNSQRTIMIDSQIIDMLVSYKLWTKALKLRHGKGHSESDFAFVSTQSVPISASACQRYLKDFLRRHDLGIPNITLHGLRHTHATLLLTQGLPVHDVAERLGNTAEMIMKIYGHAIDDLKEESVTLFANALNL